MNERKKTILVYRTGQLGDTLVALPAMRAIRAGHPDAEMILLTDYHPGKSFVSSWDVLEKTGFFSDVIFYTPPLSGISDSFRFINLAIQIRKRKPDRLFYLRDSRRHTLTRDRFFFGVMCGIPECVGLDHPDNYAFGAKDKSGNLVRLPSEVQRLLAVIERAGITLPSSIAPLFQLPISARDEQKIDSLWLAQNISEGNSVIALCPGSKMPAKRWALDRFIQLGRELLNAFDDHCIFIFGGPEDRATGEEIERALGRRVTNVAGSLGLLESAEALRRCRLYLGNDTGVMHLAAAVGTPCIAIFSARDHPGRWEPYGSNHVVLRREVPCAGCMLETCVEMDMRCLKEIGVDDVLNAAKQILLARAQEPLFAGKAADEEFLEDNIQWTESF